ncbi:lymphocyte antigen 6L [Pipistrellus kuhlii]|uniref:lymphocyte antigen 6L n=1 Tax=Pipistrellus kuhlii TaxID=59472 RepID=UPI00174F2D1D|nr:lymphocyte antigen 6L [Pipistrellus kuhlii]
MEALALWALLAVLVLWGRGAAPLGLSSRRAQTGGNLTCFRCFKAESAEQCRPALCARTDRVCVAHTLTLRLSLARGARPRAAPPAGAGGRASGQPRCVLPAESKVWLMLSKRCAPRCPNANTAFEWLSEPWLLRQVHRQCCNVSFCNAAPAPRPRGPGLLLPLGLGLLAASL